MEKVSLIKSFDEVLLRLAPKHSNLIVLNGALSPGLSLFQKNFKDRYLNFGVSSQNLLAASAGFLIRGKLPFVCADALNLSTRAFQQVRNLIAYPNLNLKLVGFDAGLSLGQAGATRQALEDVALMRSIPKMQIFSPADAEQLKLVVQHMVENFGPMYLRLAHGDFPITDAKTSHDIDVLSKGRDACVFVTGALVHEAIQAVELLKDDLSITLLNVCSIKPLNEKVVLDLASKAKYVFSIEDHFENGGLGTAIAELFAEKYPSRLYKIAVKAFGESAKSQYLYKKHALNADSIANTLKKICLPS